jgi:GT2 family glycosyltransferase
VKLSVVIICWNDRKVIMECLRSIYANTHRTSFEVIISDNGSEDGSVESIRHEFPSVNVIENGTNVGFAKANNVGIRASAGEYVLILNPDTIIHEHALDTWIEYADRHPRAGAFGCRVLNPDGSFQSPARPFPTLGRSWVAALYLRKLAFVSRKFISDTYTGWSGDTEREIDWQSGCCVMARRYVLELIDGFDEQFFYHYEEVDLCRRIWNTGYYIQYTPSATITHLGGQSVGRFPIRFALEKERNRYRYFYKHFGAAGARRSRYPVLAAIRVRRMGYGLFNFFSPSETRRARLATYRVVAGWTGSIDPVRFVESGQEPQLAQGAAPAR